MAGLREQHFDVEITGKAVGFANQTPEGWWAAFTTSRHHVGTYRHPMEARAAVVEAAGNGARQQVRAKA